MKQTRTGKGKITPREFFSVRESYRNRQILLNKVQNYWLKGVLEKSLQDKPQISLDFTERLDALESPSGVGWETVTQARQSIPPGTQVKDIFAELGEGRSLLVLGEPGSGKTTILLQLAEELLQQAMADQNHPIPVIFNLSSWSGTRESIADWLIEELHIQYQINKSIAQGWLQAQQLLLLLDGLDEVEEEWRNSCVEEINQFSQEWGRTEIVVASRLQDYQILFSRLRLQKAIYLEPLTPAAVRDYLAAGNLEATAQMLAEDQALQELAATPLMLHIIALAVEEGVPEHPNQQPSSTSQRRKHLFNGYIQRMFARKDSHVPYSQKQSLHWLKQLALRMSRSSEKVFLIERLQPNSLLLDPTDGLKMPWQRRRKRPNSDYKLYSGAVQTINGLSWSAIFALIFTLGGSANVGVFTLLAAGLFSAAITKIERIEPVQGLQWSWRSAKGWLPWALLFGASGLLTAGPSWGTVLLLSGTIISGLLATEPETTSFPNQGIWESAKNATFFGSLGAILSSIGGAGLEGIIPLPYLASLSLLSGGVVGLVLALVKGGKACIQHLVLRWLLWSKGDIPWDYARFLNYAAERNLLQKVGGGYIFMHRLLQEHFLSWGMEQENQLLLSEPSNARGYLERGNLRASLGDEQGAIADYTSAIQLDPDLAEAYAGRSLIRYLQGDHSGVLSDYQQTYQLNYQLAQSLSYTEQTQEQPAGKLVKKDDRAHNYLVTLINDNVNTFNYVCQCLMKYIPGMNSDRAWQLTWKVHQEGSAIVWCGEEQLAQLYHTQLSQAGLSMDACWPEISPVQIKKIANN